MSGRSGNFVNSSTHCSIDSVAFGPVRSIFPCSDSFNRSKVSHFLPATHSYRVALDARFQMVQRTSAKVEVKKCTRLGTKWEAIERMPYPHTHLVTDGCQIECPPSVPRQCRGCYDRIVAVGMPNAQFHQWRCFVKTCECNNQSVEAHAQLFFYSRGFAA
ncbi:UNVERIFIED_CONTAM: hypothetical protein Sradi_0490200 [Sesamum radiatum]|uniref:Uncharacterized protein n=1 Tax=Sesamum radiatum TaxID=300843 RepID=A0AAW2W8N2_SESRA